MEVYLDNSATTQPYKEIMEPINRLTELAYGNPSSIHKKGLVAAKSLKESRKIIGKTLEVSSETITFTASGTEANNMAFFSTIRAKNKGKGRIITSAIEHPSILETCQFLETLGYDVKYVPCNEVGIIDLEAFESYLDDTTLLVSIQQVNSEIGTIQPLMEIGNRLKSFERTYFHTDAVQGYGKLALNPEALGLDLVSFSGHKIHGPKGVGGMYSRKNLFLKPFIFGGGQENGLRGGTENVAAIAGFSCAAEKIASQRTANQVKLKALKKQFINQVEEEISDIKINGSQNEGEGISNILSISFEGIRGEVLVHYLEEKNIFVSTRSACSSKKKSKSHVLNAIGLSEKEIEGTLRFSFSEFNHEGQLDYIIEHLKASVADMRRITRRR